MRPDTSHEQPRQSRTDGPTASIRTRIVVRALGVWVILAVVAIANGVVREAVITPRVGDAIAHVIGTATAIAAFLVVLTAYLAWSPLDHTDRELLAVGGLWTAMTVAFEFGFGHYVMGHPWSRLVADYNLLAGRVWSLFLLTLLVGPLVIGRLLRRRGRSG